MLLCLVASGCAMDRTGLGPSKADGGAQADVALVPQNVDPVTSGPAPTPTPAPTNKPPLPPAESLDAAPIVPETIDTAGPAEPTCEDGLSACTERPDAGPTCVDLTSDPGHCGSCGNACRDGQLCSQNRCTSNCALGLSVCAGACVELAVDARNCGACGVRCKGKSRCIAGLCAGGGGPK